MRRQTGLTSAEQLETTGGGSIGTVDQGTAGSDPWLFATGFGIGIYDYIAVTTNSDNDVYAFKTGGSGGTTIATLTVTYTDSTKATLLNIAKT